MVSRFNEKINITSYLYFLKIQTSINGSNCLKCLQNLIGDTITHLKFGKTFLFYVQNFLEPIQIFDIARVENLPFFPVLINQEIFPRVQSKNFSNEVPGALNFQPKTFSMCINIGAII